MTLRQHSTLMYHDVLAPGAASGREGAGPDRYKLSAVAFAEHLDLIATAVTSPPDAADDLGALAGGSSWSLTFDDGGVSAVDVAEQLAGRGWRAYFFVTSGTIGSAGFVDEEGVRELARLGHVVGSHSVTHPERMSSLPFDALVDEWQRSCTALSELVGHPVQSASVPGGYYSRAVAAAAARAGIVTLFTSTPSRAPRRTAGCLVVGRYVIRRETSATAAARAAAGVDREWLRQYLAWIAKKPVKTLGGESYVRLRQALLTRLTSRAHR